MNAMTASHIEAAPAPSAATLTPDAAADELAAAIQVPGLLAAVQADASAAWQAARTVGGGVLAQAVDQSWTSFQRRTAAAKHPRGPLAPPAEQAACDVAALRIALEARASLDRVARMNWHQARAEYARLRDGHTIAAAQAQAAAAVMHAPAAAVLTPRERADALISTLRGRGITISESYDREKQITRIVVSPAGSKLSEHERAELRALKDEVLDRACGGEFLD